MELKFFDVNCSYGKTSGPRLHYSRPEELLRIMDRNGIEKAVVFNHESIKGIAKDGNQETLDLTKNSERMIGCFVLLPTIFEENGPLDSIKNKIKENNVRFVRMFPRTHHFMLEKWQIGDVLDMLQEMRIPVIINLEELDFSDFAEIKRLYRDLPVILSGTTQWANRIYATLCNEFQNVYLETSNTIEYRGIEFLTRTLGPDKLIFGSNMPYKEPYDSIYSIVYADIPESEKDMIARGNINRIIHEIRI